MGFIHSFGSAKQILQSIKKGTCVNTCRSSWLKNIKYAIKSSSNPLNLTKEEKKELNDMIKDISGKRIKPSQKVLIRRAITYNPKSYSYKKKRGKDGVMYISLPDSKGKFHWKVYKKGMNKQKTSVSSKLLKEKGLRPNPIESATLYCGKKKKGNDGHMYLSKPNKNGVCRWIKVKD